MVTDLTQSGRIRIRTSGGESVSLPFAADYLARVLQDGLQIGERKLNHRHIGDLRLPTGELVACDPFVNPDAVPFNVRLPQGTFPVVLSIEENGADQRVAFACIRFSSETPVTWEMMLVGDQSASELKPDEISGYPVDSGTGCFMDRSAAKALDQKMGADSKFFKTMMAEMDKTYRHTWSWLNMKFADANLIAFSSGLGDGVYATYAGKDSSGSITLVVTDFFVVIPEDIGLET
jgi:hypothetical protein